MLNDPAVRYKILQVMAAENKTAGFTIPTIVDLGLVELLRIELKTKENDWPWDDYGTFNIVTAWIKGYQMAVNTTTGVYALAS